MGFGLFGVRIGRRERPGGRRRRPPGRRSEPVGARWLASRSLRAFRSPRSRGLLSRRDLHPVQAAAGWTVRPRPSARFALPCDAGARRLSGLVLPLAGLPCTPSFRPEGLYPGSLLHPRPSYRSLGHPCCGRRGSPQASALRTGLTPAQSQRSCSDLALIPLQLPTQSQIEGEMACDPSAERTESLPHGSTRLDC